MTETILCINAGSSSLKFAVRDPHGGALLHGAVEGVGTDRAGVWSRDASGAETAHGARPVSDHAVATSRMLEVLDRCDVATFAAAGHRVVHGGRDLVAPTRVDARVLDTLRELVPLAPLHLPAQIAAVEAITEWLPSLPQVACFDTAFHRRMPEIAQRFPLPEWAWEQGVCRFGFHGLSYERVVELLGPRCGRVIIAHLGSGASMAAVDNGVSIDTTMAFTPTAGLMMGTRSGDLDPGVIIAFVRDRGMSADDVDHLVNDQSGLLGVSGTTADMRELLDRRRTDPRAARAVAMFCRSARKAIGALSTTLGGVDQLVFTGGIGERASPVRAEICAGLDFLGISIDAQRNAIGSPLISVDGSRCRVRIIPADEDRVIARHTAAVAFARTPAG